MSNVKIRLRHRREHIRTCTHGCSNDHGPKNSRWLANLGSWAYELLLDMNHHVNRIRKLFNYSYWSLAAYLKHKVKNAVSYIGCFEDALAHFAKEREVDGIVCGHIHHAEIRKIDDILYCNDGDWVESCTAMFEHPDGKLELVHWAKQYERNMARDQQLLLEDDSLNADQKAA